MAGGNKTYTQNPRSTTPTVVDLNWDGGNANTVQFIAQTFDFGNAAQTGGVA
jgi:hypothetical protein